MSTWGVRGGTLSFFLFSSLLLSSLLLSSCRPSGSGGLGGPSAPRDSTVQKMGSPTDSPSVLRLSLSGEISSLDPANSYDGISAAVVYQVYEQLYEYHYRQRRPYALRPLLAKGMPKISHGGTRYKIEIKKNIRYHDHPAFGGRPRYVIAQDFVDQIKRLAFIPTRSKGLWIFEGKIKGFDEFRQKVGQNMAKFKKLSIPGVRAEGKHTLVIELLSPYPQMLYVLAMSFVSPMPMEAIEYAHNRLDRQVVGTGPFKLHKWLPSSQVVLKKFPHYRYLQSRPPIPALEKIHFHIIKESQTRWLNFRAQKIDLLVLPKDNYSQTISAAGELIPKFKKERIHLHMEESLTYWWVAFNMRDELVGKNLLLRQAIAHAIDVNRFVKSFTNNVGAKANSIYPPGIFGYSSSSMLPYFHDVKRAKKLLAQAGYPEGRGLPPLSYDVRGTGTNHRQQAEFIKKELAQIGIEVVVKLNTFPAFLNKLSAGNLQMWQGGWALDYPDAENVLQLLITKNHSPGPNATFYSNKKFDQLFSKLALLVDGPEKKKLMVQMEDMVQRDLPWVMLYYARHFILYHDRVKNFYPSSMANNYLKYVRIE